MGLDEVRERLRRVATEVGFTVAGELPEGGELPTVTVFTEDGAMVLQQRYLPVMEPGAVVEKLYRLNWDRPYDIPVSAEENGDG